MSIKQRTIWTKNLGKLIVKPVTKEIAKDLIIQNHYSHKWNNAGFGVYNFGLFLEGRENPEECLGVAVYGYMKNLKANIFHHPKPGAWVIELNRLWISDELGHNAESILIAHSIKLLKMYDRSIVAVQSFADGRLGCGTIYKAANFKYYGFHYTKFLKNQRTGEISHEQNFTNSTSKSIFLRNNIGYLLGDWKVFRVKTHRYIYPLCRHFKSKFKEQSYPEYSKGQEGVEWVRDQVKLKQKIKSILEII